MLCPTCPPASHHQRHRRARSSRSLRPGALYREAQPVRAGKPFFGSGSVSGYDVIRHVDCFRAGDGVLRLQWSQKINDLGVCFSGEYAAIREQAAAAPIWLSKFQESHIWNRALSTSFCPPRLSYEVIDPNPMKPLKFSLILCMLTASDEPSIH
jgi:hypothetical protein